MNIRRIVLFIGLLILCAVETPVNEAPSTDPDNGGLTLPQGLGALAVTVLVLQDCLRQTQMEIFILSFELMQQTEAIWHLEVSI